MQKYVRQLKTGRIYQLTDVLAKRADMVEYDPELTQKRIEAAQKRIEELENMPNKSPDISEKDLDDSQKLADLERQVDQMEKMKALPLDAREKPQTETEKEEAAKQEIIDKDPEIIKIHEMNEKDEIESYVLVEYGLDLDKRMTLGNMKSKAIELRTERLFE